MSVTRASSQFIRQQQCKETSRNQLSWCPVADRKCSRLATSETGTQEINRYCGALCWRHRWTVRASLWYNQMISCQSCDPHQPGSPEGRYRSRLSTISEWCGVEIPRFKESGTVFQKRCKTQRYFIYLFKFTQCSL